MDLDKYSEITDLNFDKPNPHLAICHKSQGYSANLRPEALLFKSGNPVPTKEIIKSLEGVVSEQELIKMTYRNMKSSLEETLEKFLRENISSNGEYIWVEVVDFNDDMVAFHFQGTLWAVNYTATEDGIVTLGEDLREASHRELYVDSETGEELIKASFWVQEKNPKTEEEKSSDDSGEIEGEGQESDSQDTPVKLEEGNDMTDKVDVQNLSAEELLKSTVFQELMKAQREAWEAEKEAELQKAARDAQTTELVKSLSFVDESGVEELVKALIGAEDTVAAELVKAMSAAQDKIEALEAEVVKAQEEVVKVKEEFGNPSAIRGEPKGKTSPNMSERQSELEKAVAATLAKKQAK
ncbi:scaffold protein [Vibrio phage ICP1]|nr:scaffold protein [Vibrio phage ICP1]QVW02410.1 scaffold protein [Vibrio phage ICP1]HAS3707722.1 hypothetical protein [Vibrio cholerae]